MVTFVFYVIPTRNIYFSPKAKNRSINFHNVFAQKFSIQVKSKYSLRCIYTCEFCARFRIRLARFVTKNIFFHYLTCQLSAKSPAKSRQCKCTLSMKQRKIWQQGISFLVNARKESFDGESICRITLAKKWGVVACKIKLLTFPAVIHFVKIFA